MEAVFKSERLLFRQFVPGDGPLIYELNCDPDVVSILCISTGNYPEDPETNLGCRSAVRVPVMLNLFQHPLDLVRQLSRES